MVRDFSQQAKEKLLNQIDAVNNDTFCFLTDRAGDLITRFGYWIGLLNIGNYTGRISEYHRKILDMNNTTKSELEEIFSDVYGVDSEFTDDFGELTKFLDERISKMNILAGQINPSFSIAPAAQIKEKCRAVNKNIESINDQVAATYDEQLSYAEGKAALESIKGMVSGALSLAGNIYGFTADVASGDFKDAAVSGWGIINSAFSIGEDLVALAMVEIGIGVGTLSEKNQNEFREKTIGMAEDYSSMEGLTDVLKTHAGSDDIYGKLWGGVAGLSQTADTTTEIYGVYKSASGIAGTVTDGIKGKLNWVETVFGEVGLDATVTDKGLTFTDVPDKLTAAKSSLSKKNLKGLNEIYREAKINKSRFSNINTVFNYGQAIFGDDKSVGEELFKNSTGGGLLTDIHDTGKDLWDSTVIVVN